MNKPTIHPSTQGTTANRPSPAGTLLTRRSQFPGTALPCPQVVDLAVTLPTPDLLTPELHPSDRPTELGEEPFSPSHNGTRKSSSSIAATDPLAQPMAIVSGGLIALLSLLVPLISVLADRDHQPETGTIPAPPALQFDGSEQPVRVTGSRPGAPAGGDSRRQSQ